MPSGRPKRKLAAVLSADVKGYSRLMEDDEEATVATVRAYQQVISSLIESHSGRVVDSPGDNVLAEFASVVDAVRASLEIQADLKQRNDKLPEKRRMEFRIGINLGDVIEEESRLYGDGVNIAARLESLAEPGGICVSKSAFDQIETKLPFGYEYLGEQSVKNITKPVGAYRVFTEPDATDAAAGQTKTKAAKGVSWRQSPVIAGAMIVLVVVVGAGVWHLYSRRSAIEPVSSQEMASPLPDLPSIAVLPFVNMSDDPQQEYFSDGISEDIITDLSKISRLLVIARNSSFAYKGKSVDAQQIGQELKVRYLLEGSVRKAGDKVRINAQLIDASSGHHLWAERYDGELVDVFALQDKITGKIISALALKLTAGEQKALTDKGTANLQAYDAFLKGWQGYRSLTKSGFAEARIQLERAVELDPEFSRAYAALAALYWKAIQLAAPELREGLGLTNRALKNAVRTKPHFLVKKAMKKPTALAHGLMSQFYLFRYQHDEALAEIERAVALDPNDPELYAWMSHILWLIGKSDDAMESLNKGLRLDPVNRATYLIQLARAYLPDGDLEESLHVLKEEESISPELSGSIALTQAIIYGIQSRNEEARASYKLYVESRQHPVFNLNDILLYLPFKDPKKLERIADALIKAGAPGKPTDYYKILKGNRVGGEEVKSLLLGHKITGIAMSTGKEFWWEWREDGEFQITGPFQDTGKSWAEADVFFIQFNKAFGGLPYGTVIYRNPDGSRERMNQYLMVSDIGSITPFAPTD